MTSIDYSYFISAHSSRRRPALTRVLTKCAYGINNVISLAEGMPNDATFPFEKIEILLKDGSKFSLDGHQLNAALQYIPSQGYPPLIKTLKEFTQKVHQPPNWADKELLITNGSQDGLSKAIEFCIEEGDPVIVQNPFYAGTEIILKPFKPELIAIDQDQNGMTAYQLEHILEERKAKYTEEGDGIKMPKVMYINPTGSNPSGTTMSTERRLEIYRICCKYNILILEDDAYHFMNFLEENPPSFLTLDTEGRVLHFDSFSKVLSSGLRVGYVVGPKPIINSIELHVQSATLHSSTLSQVIVENLIQKWGFDKLIDHFRFVKDYYKARRDFTLEALEKHLKGLCDWEVPAGGMFVWIKVRGVSDVYDMLMIRGLKKGITFVPGHAFMADPSKACSFIRASYSKVPLKQIEKAMKLLAELIREEQLLLRRKLDNCT